MADKLIIDGIQFNIPVIELSRSAEILDKYANRTDDGDLHREPIGTYINYTFTFGTIDDIITYNALFDKLVEPVAFHDVVFPINSKYNSGKYYITGISDSVRRVLSNGTLFTALKAQAIAKSPTIRG